MTEPVEIIDKYGTISWRLSNGVFHRLDGPAIFWINGGQEWWLSGLRHRLDGPAYTGPDGREEWYKFNELHRDDGPAVTQADGYQAWFQHGQRHRVDGPAIIFEDGHQEWFQDGMHHRLDGPAIIYPSAEKWPDEWWVNGEVITRRVFEWVLDNGLPDWKQWDDETKILFRMRFQ